MSKLKPLGPFVLSILLTVNTVFCLADGGGSGTGGGSSIQCSASGSRFPVDGWYFLDYAIGKNAEKNTEKNSEKNSERLPFVYKNDANEHLKKVMDKFDTGFRLIFGNSSRTTSNFNPSNWKPLPYPLQSSEPLTGAIEVRIPPNCDKSSLKQIVTYDGSGSRFYLNLEGLAELKKTGISQVSYLYIHELLRSEARIGFLDIVEWTNVIHSANFIQLRGSALVDDLAQIGLIYDRSDRYSERVWKISQIKEFLIIMEQMFPTGKFEVNAKSLQRALDLHNSYNSSTRARLGATYPRYNLDDVKNVVPENQCQFKKEIENAWMGQMDEYSKYEIVSEHLGNYLKDLYQSACSPSRSSGEADLETLCRRAESIALNRDRRNPISKDRSAFESRDPGNFSGQCPGDR